MRFYVTGARGQLGRALLELGAGRGHELAGGDLPEVDVRDAAVLGPAVAAARPDWVLHCAARTDVDGCEGDPAGAFRANRDGALNALAAARAAGAGLLLVSTDFVFDGAARRPYRENDAMNPLSVYGRSKAAGERACREAWPEGCWVVRTQWLYGPGGRHFPGAILRRARTEGRLRVVADQVGCPTLTRDLAAAMLDLAAAGAPPGIYHASNEGEASWHGFACAILARAGLGAVPVEAIAAADLALPARRPAWSVLDKGKLAAALGRRLRPWEDALEEYLVDLGGAREGI